MAFLDNSGNIILDAVLTDLGRRLIARGDGSFKITHFSLGDDEVDYSLYDTTLSTELAGGTIRQLPVLEASTANTAALKHKLVSYARNDLLFLPTVKLNELDDANARSAQGYFVVTVDKDTDDLIFADGSIKGIISGYRPDRSGAASIRIDQGLDTTKISYEEVLPNNLKETDYKIMLDSRLGLVVSQANVEPGISAIDENSVATFEAFMEQGAEVPLVMEINNFEDSKFETIQGPRGTSLKFSIRASVGLRTSNALFTELGGTMNSSTFLGSGTSDLYYIDTTVKVEGGNTGGTVTVPLRFIKKIA